MGSDEITIKILESIRDEIRNVRDETRGVAEELRDLKQTTNERFDALERRQAETEIRLSSALTAVVGALNDVKQLLKENLSSTLKDHERRIAALETRTGA